MTTSAATDPWATNDHDPLSIAEHNIAAHPKTMTARAISGGVIAEYPDFAPGTPSGYCRRSSRTPCPPLAASSRTTGASSGPPATPNTPPSATTATTSRSPSNATAYNRARPYKTFNVDVAIDEPTWPFLGNRYTVTLAEIRRRITAAGLD
jgi:hypothetical protein